MCINLGVLVCQKGCVLITGTQHIQANWSVDVTEAAAALYGLEVAHRAGYGEIHLEGDALTVTNAISRKQQRLLQML